MSRAWWVPLAALVATVMVVVFLVGGNADDHLARPAPQPDVTVIASLDEPVRTRGSMNGFIHSLDRSQPPDWRVEPLTPRLWRSDSLRAPIDRATAFGASYQLVLSDLWGYPQSDWNGHGPPWRDLRGWERFVRDTAREYRGRPVTWDIWNEPNDPGFWSGGRKRFFDVYSRANRVLREELGADAVIGGPSVSRYAPRWLASFLNHCLDERCRLDFLAWHENLEPSDPIESISANLVDGRKRFVKEPRYEPLGLSKIHINEYVGKSDRHRPGEAVSYLAQLERGGADRAARSCWSREDCSPAGLGGLLSSVDGLPRASWWVHRWYAEGADSRVRSESSDEAVPVLASADDDGARVLLSHAPRRAPGAPPPAAAKRVELRLSGGALSRESRVRVVAERVPAAGEAPVPAPSRVFDRKLRPHRGSLVVELPPLAAHTALRLTAAPA